MIWANYCHGCRAWSTQTSSWTQTGDDTAVYRYDRRTEFGPFDSWMDVRDAMEGAVEDVMAYADAPWFDDDYSWRAVDPDHPSLGETP